MAAAGTSFPNTHVSFDDLLPQDVFPYLDIGDLKSCRLVNKIWLSSTRDSHLLTQGAIRQKLVNIIASMASEEPGPNEQEVREVFAGKRDLLDLDQKEFLFAVCLAIKEKNEKMLNQFFAQEKHLANLGPEGLGKIVITACKEGDITTFGRIRVSENLIRKISAKDLGKALHKTIGHPVLFSIFLNSDLIKDISEKRWGNIFFSAARSKNNSYFEQLLAKEDILQKIPGDALDPIIRMHNWESKYPLDRIFTNKILAPKIPSKALSYAFRIYWSNEYREMTEIMLAIPMIRARLDPVEIERAEHMLKRSKEGA